MCECEVDACEILHPFEETCLLWHWIPLACSLCEDHPVTIIFSKSIKLYEQLKPRIL